MKDTELLGKLFALEALVGNIYSVNPSLCEQAKKAWMEDPEKLPENVVRLGATDYGHEVRDEMYKEVRRILQLAEQVRVPAKPAS